MIRARQVAHPFTTALTISHIPLALSLGRCHKAVSGNILAVPCSCRYSGLKQSDRKERFAERFMLDGIRDVPLDVLVRLWSICMKSYPDLAEISPAHTSCSQENFRTVGRDRGRSTHVECRGCSLSQSKPRFRDNWHGHQSYGVANIITRCDSEYRLVTQFGWTRLSPALGTRGRGRTASLSGVILRVKTVFLVSRAIQARRRRYGQLGRQ
ncbi:hypothetical protein EDB92DRAFT_1031733 [Lactarius akahatsu]|uniref:Uncharacterized protein n=1 Tax=Lactarius akahatsu TaxID=416441 RepID=A0AAD4LCV3_9AGAM|nr:hypothetical protein EDB92DRAFT_1031733 [Lactarius akahatsu]